MDMVSPCWASILVKHGPLLRVVGVSIAAAPRQVDCCDCEKKWGTDRLERRLVAGCWAYLLENAHAGRRSHLDLFGHPRYFPAW
jgi:hypothetical protein